MRKSLSIIIPCYNEEGNIHIYEEELFGELNKLNIRYTVIFVDDGSTDNTRKELLKLQKKYKNIVIHSFIKNKGMGMAIREGIKLAENDLSITLDADLTFHPDKIKELLSRFFVGDVDCIIGSTALAGYGKGVPFYRKFLSISLNLIYSILLGKRLTSVSPIFRVYNTQDLKDLNLTCKGFDINAEILVNLLKNEKKVVEIPTILTVRRFGESKINNIKEIKNHIKLFFKIMRWKFR